MPLISNVVKVFTLLCLLFQISGCRYWSLYRFADQLCHFDEQIEVVSHLQETQIMFADPVLPVHVFDRYFKAAPYQINEAESRISKTYQLLSRYDSTQRIYRLHADFSTNTRKPLLAEAAIDSSLSAVFKPAFVKAILRSSCTDDFDLSLSEIDARFVLLPISPNAMPNVDDLTALFGPGLPSNQQDTDQRHYSLDFQAPATSLSLTQDKPVFLRFSFSQQGRLTQIDIDYLNYAMRLDFINHRGHLNIVRGNKS